MKKNNIGIAVINSRRTASLRVGPTA